MFLKDFEKFRHRYAKQQTLGSSQAKLYDLVQHIRTFKEQNGKLGFLDFAMKHYAADDYSSAIDYVDRAIAMDSTNRDALLFKLKLAYELGDLGYFSYEQTEDLIENVFTMHPDDELVIERLLLFAVNTCNAAYILGELRDKAKEVNNERFGPILEHIVSTDFNQ